MELWVGAMNLGFLYAFMALGTFITYRYFNIADITIDGSFTLGAATGAMLIIDGWNPFLVLPVSFTAGAMAGFVTGLIHTRFKIDSLLSGILVMTGLYSVNLHIMGKSNIPLMNHPTFERILGKLNPGLPEEIWTGVILLVVMLAVWLLLSAFLKSDLGLTMLATGNNPVMISAQGVSTDRMKLLGITLANGLVGLSGILVAQYQGFADIGMGIGSIIYSLAAVIIGQALFRTRKVLVSVLGVILGAVIFRLAVAVALKIGFDPNDLKILTALFVLLTLVISYSMKNRPGGNNKVVEWIRKHRMILLALFVLGLLAWFALKGLKPGNTPAERKAMPKIGIIITNQSNLLMKTRDGFMDEMKRLGYKHGVNCEIREFNAEGDIPANKTIVDHLVAENADLLVPISSASTQAAVSKVKDRPIVFATVADPFILGAGVSPINHPANVTGIYGHAPVKELLYILTKIFPGKRTIGTIYNPGYPNTKVNLGDLKKAVKDFPQITLEEVSVSGTGDVLQAAQSLASKNICAFLLINDLSVFDALESVVRVSKMHKKPIFANDADCLEKGAFLVYGYEYYISGVQAARLSDRILRGESPAGIPYERFAHILLGINKDLVAEYGLKIPDSLMSKAEATIRKGKFSKKPFTLPVSAGSARPVKMALFQYAHNRLLDQAMQGFRDEMIREKYVHGRKIEMSFFNAQGEFSIAQSVAKNIMSEEFDYIATFSTIALQTMAGVNDRIPQVFSAVTDPIQAGVASGAMEHRPNLTGVATPQPVAATIRLIKALLPKAHTIGMVWNTSELNSEICTKLAREACKTYGFRLIERTVTGTNEVDEAVKALIASGIDVFFVSGDVTTSQVIPSIARLMRDKKIPFFTNTPEDIQSGILASFGASYYEVGKKAGTMMTGIMNGASPADIPIEWYIPEKLCLNLAIAKEQKIQIPDTILNKAVVKVYK